MCNDYGNNIPYTAYLEAFSETRIPIRFPRAAPNLEPRDDIWPTDTAPVIRQVEDGFGFAQLRWGFPPARAKGAPIINFRSEGRRFPKARCLIPASHFFEFTGSKSPKSKWKFTKAGDDWFCFAGLWRPMPEAPVRPLQHDHLSIVNGPEAELLRPLPAGSLHVEQVR